MTTFVTNTSEAGGDRIDTVAAELRRVTEALDRLESELAGGAVLMPRHQTIVVGDLLALDGRIAELDEQLRAIPAPVDTRWRAQVDEQRLRFDRLRADVTKRLDSHAGAALSAALSPAGTPRMRRRGRAVVGSIVTVIGVVMVAFVLFQLLVTPLIADRSQRELAGELDLRLTTAAAVAAGDVSLAPTEFGFGDLDPENPVIPDLGGELPSTARAKLEELGFEVVLAPEADRDQIPGLVVRTIPAEGESAPKGSEVTLTVSTLAKGSPVGSLAAPSIGLSAIVIEGSGSDELMAGPGHYRDSPLPGEPGNAVILGRRTTYGGPFNRISELAEGDEIEVLTLAGLFTYEVAETKVVRPGDADVFVQDDRNILTLVTSNPEYRATDRLAVVAELQGEPVGRSQAGSGSEEEVVGQAPVLTPDELGRERNPSAWAPLLLWGELFVLAVVVAAVLYKRWRRWPTWLITTPIIVALAVLVFENVGRLLPSTL
jgi:LPXTG-site transpeptidase (sortase) family protein